MTETTQVQRWVSRVTLALLALLTVASIVNLHDMAEATHTADGVTAWIVAVAIGGTLSVLVYVASITDGQTRVVATRFGVFAAVVSTVLQVSLFVSRGADMWVALAFGVGVPFFEVALALTDSMLRRYVAPATVKVVQNTTVKPKRTATVTEPAQVDTSTVDAVTPETVTPIQVDTPAKRKPNAGVTELARQLGVSRTTVYRRIQAGELQLNGTGD